MTNSMIPYSFTPGTKAKAQEVNANFNALADKIDENNETALHYNTSATISGDMTFTKPIVSTGNYVVTKGNLTITNLPNNGTTDAVLAINSDTNQNCGSLRLSNGNGYNEVTLTAAAENGSILSMGIRNTNGTAYAFCPTYTTDYADSSTKIVTTEYMANHWCNTEPTTSSTASKARPVVIIENYVNGTSGYILYSNGLCEQWGHIGATGAVVTTTFIKPFKNTDYCIVSNFINGTTNNSFGARQISILSKTETSFKIDRDYADRGSTDWRAIGYV